MKTEDIKFYISRFRKNAVDNKTDKFIDIFDDFIKILLEQDLSKETLEYLLDIFEEDMKIYFRK